MAEEGGKAIYMDQPQLCSWPLTTSTWLWELWSSGWAAYPDLLAFIVEVSLQIVAGQQTSNFQQAMQSAVPTAAELIHRAQKGGITRRSCTESDAFKASSKAICNDKQSKGFLLVTEVFGTMENYTTISPVATKEKYMYMISEDPIQRDLREKWCFHAHLNSRGMEWNGMGKVGTLGTYIYLHNGDGDDDAWTMVHLQKNILPTFFLSFLTKITTMHYLPAWWASFNKWTEWYTSLDTSNSVCDSKPINIYIYRKENADGWHWWASLQWSLRVKMLWNEVWATIM